MSSLGNLPTRQLGKNGPQVPRLGLGLMTVSGTYNMPLPEDEALAFLDEAYKKGETFWDTADKYGDSEKTLSKWFAANPDKRNNVFLATKFGIKTAPGAPTGFTIDSTPDYCREAIEMSLERLNLPFVDLYYVHRLDKVTPIEKTIEAMVELKNAGKFKYLGLSECSAASLRRAYAVHPITCVEVEYSPFCLDIEQNRLLETARELGVAVVTYSPLGNGFLSGTIRTREDVSKPGDLRKVLPWLEEENFQQNLVTIDKLSDIAKVKGITLAQLTLAWLLAQGDDVFPIPGTTKLHRLAENLGSLFVSLSPEEEKAVRHISQGVLGQRFQIKTGYAFADTPAL